MLTRRGVLMPDPDARDSEALREATRAYEASVLEAITQLTAGMRRAAALVNTVQTSGDAPDRREMAIEECRSWRGILDRLPGEPPPVYRGVHARVVRWAAVVAQIGDLQVAALDSRRPEDQRIVTDMAAEVAARYRDIVVAMERLAASRRDAR